jgi:hypothetical protein
MVSSGISATGLRWNPASAGVFHWHTSARQWMPPSANADHCRSAGCYLRAYYCSTTVQPVIHAALSNGRSALDGIADRRDPLSRRLPIETMAQPRPKSLLIYRNPLDFGPTTGLQWFHCASTARNIFSLYKITDVMLFKVHFERDAKRPSNRL